MSLSFSNFNAVSSSFEISLVKTSASIERLRTLLASQIVCALCRKKHTAAKEAIENYLRDKETLDRVSMVFKSDPLNYIQILSLSCTGFSIGAVSKDARHNHRSEECTVSPALAAASDKQNGHKDATNACEDHADHENQVQNTVEAKNYTPLSVN